MTADTIPPAELAGFIDAQGHRVTATVTLSGLLAVLSRDPDEGLRDGHPCLDKDMARKLGTALLAFANNGEGPLPDEDDAPGERP